MSAKVESNEVAMSPDREPEHFQGFSENHYQHGMHTLAWISLWLIILCGVGAGVFGFVWGLNH
ncbi:MAG: hypothetical protein L0H31_10420 [Nocardioidaceae bacterium]|nr:hypothetical protein [Nocardioidaceae bacterium]